MQPVSYSAVFVERLSESQGDLYSFVASLLPFNPDDVDDIVQETNLSMMREAAKYDESRPFRPWMFTIALRRVQDFRRTKVKEKTVFNDEALEKAAASLMDESSDVDDGSHATLLKHLAECKKRLKDNQRELIDLRYTQRLHVAEIAKAKHLTLFQVRDALAYIRRKLAECVRRFCRVSGEADTPALSEMETTVADVLDFPATDESRQRLESAVNVAEDLTDYADQMLIHHLLSRGWVKRDARIVLPARRFPFGKILAFAAGLAILAAGGVLLARRQGAPKPPAVAAVVQKPPVAVESRRLQPEPVQEKREAALAQVAAGAPPVVTSSFTVAKATASLSTAGAAGSSSTRQIPPQQKETKAPSVAVAAAPKRKEQTMKNSTLTKAAATAAVAAALTASIPQEAVALEDFPAVSNVKLTQPFASRTLEIGYTLANGPAIVTIDITTNGVSIGDTHNTYFTGEVNKLVTNGTYTVLWETKYAWPDHTNTQARAVVTAWSTNCPPDYMVLVPTSSTTYATRYYTSADALPDGGLANDEYRLSRFVLRKIHAAGQSFSMGSNPGDTGRQDVRETMHTVSLTKDFYIGVYQVTQEQWKNIYGSLLTPYFTNRTDSAYRMRPMEEVSFLDIRESVGTAMASGSTNAAYQWPNDPCPDSFLGILRTRSGVNFDLPSDAQWEFACRSGHAGNVWNDGSTVLAATDADANLNRLGRNIFNGGSGSNNDATNHGTAVVGSYRPNDWGLYDMHGNVWEWCVDCFVNNPTGEDGNIDPVYEKNPANGHVERGAGFGNTPNYCRSARRGQENSPVRGYNIGFRLYAPGIAGNE